MLVAVAAGCSESQSQSKDKPADAKESAATMTTTDYLNVPFKTIAGEDTRLADFKGQVVLIVNTASKCGYTPQYEGLQALYQQYKDSGLVVIGFPANNFGGQEPGSNEEIATFCSTKFDVTFPMMAKVSVKGDDIHPLFRFMTQESGLTGEIGWNFSKFLIDRDGQLVARYPSKVTPQDPELTSKISSLF